MKVYVYCSAMHDYNECVDIINVQVFTTMHEALQHLEETVAELTSEEGGWTVFSKRPRNYQLTDGETEYVACVTEREI